jgi:antitoxin ParD1/3/4
MTVKTTLSFTDRHHRYLTEKVGEGVFASASSAVASAIEQLMQDEIARDHALVAMAEDIRSRLATPPGEYIEPEEAFRAARATLNGA